MPPKREAKTDRLDELIDKLDERLKLLHPPALKERLVETLRELSGYIEKLEETNTKLLELCGCSYSDINR
jgi:hypothetical protein